MVAPFVPIDRDSAALGTLIDPRQVAGLPLDGRNFLELALLAPGTVAGAAGIGQLGARGLRVQRQRRPRGRERLPARRRLQHRPEAGHVRRPAAGRRASTSSSVETSTYDASFGRNAAGQVNVVTRVRLESALAARPTSSSATARSTPATSSRRATSRRPTTTATSSAARSADRSRANRAFFFADYESTRLREGITRVTNVPTLAERQGDFSQSLFAPPRRSVLAASRFRAAQIPSFFHQPDRRGDCGALSAAEPQHAVRELRLVADAARRRRSVRRADRSRRSPARRG